MRKLAVVTARYSASLPISHARMHQLDADIIAAVLLAIVNATARVLSASRCSLRQHFAATGTKSATSPSMFYTPAAQLPNAQALTVSKRAHVITV